MLGQGGAQLGWQGLGGSRSVCMRGYRAWEATRREMAQVWQSYSLSSLVLELTTLCVRWGQLGQPKTHVGARAVPRQGPL